MLEKPFILLTGKGVVLTEYNNLFLVVSRGASVIFNVVEYLIQVIIAESLIVLHDSGWFEELGTQDSSTRLLC